MAGCLNIEGYMVWCKEIQTSLYCFQVVLSLFMAVQVLDVDHFR